MSVVEAEHLQKTFALGFFRKKVRAVDDASFTVEKNEIFGFLGPNGAGKTTTLKMLMGLIFRRAARRASSAGRSPIVRSSSASAFCRRTRTSTITCRAKSCSI